MWPRNSVCRQRRPPLADAPAGGGASAARWTTSFTVCDQSDWIAAWSTTMPFSRTAASTASDSNSSPVNRQSPSSAASAPQHPVAAVAQMIAVLLQRLRRDRRERRERAPLQRIPLQHTVRVEQELPHDREREIADGEFHELRVAILRLGAEIRERVLVARRPFGLAGELEQRAALPHEVERDVRHRNVFLEDRTVSAPLAHAVAEHEAVVPEPQEGLEQRVRGRC